MAAIDRITFKIDKLHGESPGRRAFRTEMVRYAKEIIAIAGVV